MKQHMREFFVARIRSGRTYVEARGQKLYVVPTTIEQDVEAANIYMDAYNEAYLEEVMTEDDMLDWMYEHSIWTIEDDNQLKGIQKDLEKLRKEIYLNRNVDSTRERIRLYIRAASEALEKIYARKLEYRHNTCEGVAETARDLWKIEQCTYNTDGTAYDFSMISQRTVLNLWRSAMHSETEIRDIVRNEPWKTTWSLKDAGQYKLFENNGQATEAQKALLVWSQIYDNIQQSIDCPEDFVIEDDDLLDGWFIKQSDDRKRDKAQNDFESSTNDKIKNSDEIFVVAQNDRHREDIENMNSPGAQFIKRQREGKLKRRHDSGAEDALQAGGFQDERLKMVTQSNQMFKGKFRGG